MHLVNLSIDDVSPHERSSTKVLEQCYRVLEVFPDARFTLFVPTAYWRTIGDTATDWALTLYENPAFCDELRALPTDNFEVCFHGHHHGVPGRSNNDEMKVLGYDDALQVIDRMQTMVTMAGLVDVFKPILRPPAWRMSPDCFRACHDKDIKTLALARLDHALSSYQGAHESDMWKGRIVYQTCNPPFSPLGLSPDGKTEIVYHACQWDKNHLSRQLADELIMFLQAHRDEFEFSFIEGLL